MGSSLGKSTFLSKGFMSDTRRGFAMANASRSTNPNPSNVPGSATAEHLFSK